MANNVAASFCSLFMRAETACAPSIEAQRELEALIQALKVDSNLLSAEQLVALEQAKVQLESQLASNNIKAIEQAVQQLKTHSDAFAAARMNQHIDAALKGTQLDDWSNSPE